MRDEMQSQQTQQSHIPATPVQGVEAKRKDIGAMWQRTGKNGIYFGITIDGVRYMAFKNNYKEKENQPDYRIFPQETNLAGGAFQKRSTNDEVPF